jgi:chaperonin GroES
MTIKILGNKVAIKVTKKEEKKTSGGLIIPEGTNLQNRVEQGIVFAVGTGKVTNEGTVLPITDVKVGNMIVYPKYSVTEVTIDNEDFIMVDVDQILAIMED